MEQGSNPSSFANLSGFDRIVSRATDLFRFFFYNIRYITFAFFRHFSGENYPYIVLKHRDRTETIRLGLIVASDSDEGTRTNSELIGFLLAAAHQASLSGGYSGLFEYMATQRNAWVPFFEYNYTVSHPLRWPYHLSRDMFLLPFIYPSFIWDIQDVSAQKKVLLPFMHLLPEYFTYLGKNTLNYSYKEFVNRFKENTYKINVDNNDSNLLLPHWLSFKSAGRSMPSSVGQELSSGYGPISRAGYGNPVGFSGPIYQQQWNSQPNKDQQQFVGSSNSDMPNWRKPVDKQPNARNGLQQTETNQQQNNRKDFGWRNRSNYNGTDNSIRNTKEINRRYYNLRWQKKNSKKRDNKSNLSETENVLSVSTATTDGVVVPEQKSQEIVQEVDNLQLS